MRERIGDMWQVYKEYDAFCVTTNMDLRKDNTAVMGAGCAGEAAKRFPGIQKHLGLHIKRARSGVYSNGGAAVVQIYTWPRIFAFPTKYHWYDHCASISLIRQSAKQLMELLDKKPFMNSEREIKSILLPQPGTGKKTGRLDWESEVKPVLAEILDDRVTVIGLPARGVYENDKSGIQFLL